MESQSKSRVGCIALTALVAVVGLLVYVGIQESRVSIEGSLETEEAWGASKFTPTGCRSGELANFHGVDLFAANDARRVRVLVNETGTSQLVLFQSGREPQVLTSADCTNFRIGVRCTGTRVNHVWAYTGVAQVTCPLVRGHLAFENCAK